MSDHHILVVGSGSVGKRHLRNLSALGCRVSAIDPRRDRLDEAAAEVALEGSFQDLGEAIRKGGFSGAVVASPPKFHVPQCIELAREGIPILLEKPVAKTLREALELDVALAKYPGAKLLLGYSYRWWPPLNDVRSRIGSGEIGRPLHAKFVMSAHLADWHPWAPYQAFFMASRDLGGGALLDESHFIDLMISFFGMPRAVFAVVENIRGPRHRYRRQRRCNCVLRGWPAGDPAPRSVRTPHEKFITVTGETGTLGWSFEPNRIRLGRDMAQVWTDDEFKHERNDMFVETAREFIGMLEGQKAPRCSLQDGINVLKVIEACRESAEKGQVVEVGA
jgi:predicted dehydrogenase